MRLHLTECQTRTRPAAVFYFFFSSRRRHTRWTGDWSSDVCSSDPLAKAELQLRNAEEVYGRKSDKKSVIAAAREVVETAEESRVMAVKQKAEEDANAKIAWDKKAAEEREAKARADAVTEVQRRQEAEKARQQAETAKAEALRMQQEAQQAAAAAGRQQAEAEKASAAALLQQQAAQAEAEKAQLRAQLLAQLNSILQTRDSARGLIVNMSDVLFDTGSYTLKPG